ncbi:MAG TPA: hypothetical protein VN811_00850 [Thermoanaerobaculia bacterium]|nr:hypothetical protein [Thermoanaerobaculia bacterium]HXT49554.1 hypothetical protein [Thermoanaerobaculia bacterium]
MTAPLVPAPQLDTIPFAVLIDEAWKSTRAWARTILLPAMLLLAPGALAMQVLAGFWNLSLLGNVQAARFDRFCGTFAIGILGILVVAVYFVAVYGCVMVAAVRALGGESPSLRQCLRFYARPRVWGTDLLAWLLTMLGFFACIVPGLFLLGAWALRLPVMVREGRSGWDALKRSWELLAHNPSGQLMRHPLLKVLLLFVLGAVLGYAISLVIQMPAVIVSQLMMVRGMSRGEAADPQAMVRATLWLTIPAGTLAALAQLAVQLYVDFATAHVYLDQVRRKEGADLGSALDRLLGETPPPVVPGQPGPPVVPGPA